MAISHKHFGSIYSGFPQDSHYEAVQSVLETVTVRWPGGFLAEERTDVYDIASSEIFDPSELFATNENRDRYSLSEAVSSADQGSQSLTVVIPTYRYEQSLEQGEADLLQFLQNTAALPELHGKTLRLEIGNEYYASDSLTADEYGAMAQRFASVIDDFEGGDVTFKTIVQMGKSTSDNADILAHFSAEDLGRVDGVSFHMLPINLNNLYNATHDGQSVRRLDVIEYNASAWQQAASLGGLSNPVLHMSAWSVGEATNDPSSVNLAYQDYGARAAVSTLALFTEAIHLGVDEAAAWGVGESGLSSLGKVVEDQVQLTHSGVMLSELNNSILGLDLANYSASQDFDWSTGLEVGKAVYTGLGRMVLYVANGEDIPSSATRLGAYSSDFSMETAKIIEAKRISTAFLEGYTPTGSGEDRLHEVPIVEEIPNTSPDLILDGEWLSHKQTQTHQVQEITLSWQHTGSDEDEALLGYAQADWFDGGAGNDTMHGHEDQDTLSGGLGNDWVEGGAGSDVLNGNQGHDVIIGDSEVLSNWHLTILGQDDFSFV